MKTQREHSPSGLPCISAAEGGDSLLPIITMSTSFNCRGVRLGLSLCCVFAGRRTCTAWLAAHEAAARWTIRCDTLFALLCLYRICLFGNVPTIVGYFCTCWTLHLNIWGWINRPRLLSSICCVCCLYVSCCPSVFHCCTEHTLATMAKFPLQH